MPGAAAAHGSARTPAPAVVPGCRRAPGGDAVGSQVAQRRVIDDRRAVRRHEAVTRRAVEDIAASSQLGMVVVADGDLAVEHDTPVRQVAPAARVAAAWPEDRAHEDPIAHAAALDVDGASAPEGLDGAGEVHGPRRRGRRPARLDGREPERSQPLGRRVDRGFQRREAPDDRMRLDAEDVRRWARGDVERRPDVERLGATVLVIDGQGAARHEAVMLDDARLIEAGPDGAIRGEGDLHIGDRPQHREAGQHAGTIDGLEFTWSDAHDHLLPRGV
jgi:hypothetical protein